MEKIRCPGCMRLRSPEGPCGHCGFAQDAANASHQLQIGTVLKEQYQIGKVLGQGGFGITYLGWDLYLDIPVAIKEYYPSGTVMRDAAVTLNVTDISGDDGARYRSSRERFMREAKMLARFSQVPEVVQVKNFFLANNTAYIVMEYVEGITLKQYVQQQGGKLSPEETFAIVGPIIQTMAKVHKTGIIHRDISPDNIMMVPGGAKLLDFGAVRAVEGAAVNRELTRSTEAILKQGYAPIEQYQKKGALGPWTDVYALCATIYYCLTGEVPPDAPARVLEYEVLDEAALDALTQWQKAALLHGLELRTDRRTGSMEQLYGELLVNSPPEPKPEPMSVSKPAPVTEVKPVSKPKPVTEAKPVSKEKPVSKPVPEPKPEPNAGSRQKMAAILAAGAALVALFAAVVFGLTRETPEAEPAEAYLMTGTCGEDCSWELDLTTGEMKITGIGNMDDFWLDSYEDSMRQDKVERPWEEYTHSIKSVSFAEEISGIGTAAFAHCPNLEKVTFGKYLRRIGTDAFWDTGLTDVEFPVMLTVIEDFAFENTRLQQLTIPIAVKLGQGVFSNCPELTLVNISGGVTWDYNIRSSQPSFSREGGSIEGITLRGPEGGIVEDYARILGYDYLSDGTQVNYEGQGDFSGFPGNPEGRWYFDVETGFLKIEGEMPADMLGSWEDGNEHSSPERRYLPRVPWTKFAENISIVSVESGVTRISSSAFSGLNKLRYVYLPDTLRSIGFQSFLDTAIETLIIPDSVEQIEAFSFNYSKKLKTVKLPMGLEKLEQGTFNMSPMLERVYAGNGTQIDWYEKQGNSITPFNNDVKTEDGTDEFALPENLTIFTPQEIHNGQLCQAKEFADAVGVEYQVGVFGHENPEECGDVLYEAGALCWVLEEGVLTLTGRGETPFFRSGQQDRYAWNTLHHQSQTLAEEAPWYPWRDQIRAVHVGPCITVLNRGMLCDMPNLESVELGRVEAIYDGAIENCGVQELVFPDTLGHVHKGAVKNCSALRSILVYDGSEKMDYGAFQGCDGLEELTFWSGKENIAEHFDLFNGSTPRGLTIIGRLSSPAQKYAQRMGIPFERLQ